MKETIMAAESSSRSNFSADSYIGSLISLISKSEIRYEGVLFTINASESSIGLRNVRSFGTEGRKRDGPQFPPSDKVYEYILFHGSDIKDLQVKSSPPVEATAPIYKDPAIIESHYSQGEGPTSLTPSDNGSRQDFTSQTPQLGLPNSTFQGNAPLHQPSQSSGLWGSSQPPPISNGSSFPMPFYLHGFYGASNGLQTPHQSLFQQAPGLSMPLPIHQTVQHPVISAPLPSLTSNLPALPLSVSPPSLMPPFNVGNLSSDLMLSPQTSVLVTDSSTTSMPNKSPTQVHPAVSSSSLPLITQLNNVSFNKSPFSTPTPEKIEKVAGSVSYSSGFQPEPFPTETSGSFPNNGPRPLLITPNQLLQRGPSPTQLLQPGPTPNQKMLSAPTNQNLQPGCTSNQLSQSGPAPNQCLQPVQFSQPGSSSNQNFPPGPLLQPGPTPSQVLQSGLTTNQVMQPGAATSLSNFCSESAQKDVEMVQVSSLEPSVSKLRDGQPPLLPLPSSFDRKGTRHATRFTEDFDFIAMNEKFNKDEIWGHLGKIDTTEEDDHDFQEEDDRVRSSFGTKPVYVKDDFFDSLSCNVSDRESCNGRINFSEQRKLDVETFGNFPRYRGGRGYGHGTRGYAGGVRGYAGGGRGGYAGGGYGRRNSGHNGRVWGHHAI